MLLQVDHAPVIEARVHKQMGAETELFRDEKKQTPKSIKVIHPTRIDRIKLNMLNVNGRQLDNREPVETKQQCNDTKL